MKLNRYLLLCVIVTSLGGLLFGFDTAVISGTEKALQRLFHLSGFWHGFTVASALIGTVIGSLVASYPADRWGRRLTLIVIAILYFVSAVGSALAWDWYSLVFFRFIGGLAVGGASVVAPMYIAEISPPQWRGRLVAIVQFNIVFGILLAFFSNFCVTLFNLGDLEWRWMLGVEAFPAAVFWLLLYLTPQSPRWLVVCGRDQEAVDVFVKLGVPPQEAQELVSEIRSGLERTNGNEPLFCPRYMRLVLLALAIAAFNQLSGINAILYYAPRIFQMAGAGKYTAFLQSVAVGGTNLIFTMLAMSVIDRFGRKFLMLVGSIGYILSLSAVATAFYIYGAQFDTFGNIVVLVSLIVFIASHAFGQGAVIWVFISEIFPNTVRAKGQALGSFTHWFMCAVISWTFPVIAEQSGGHAFAFYAAMMVLQLLWVIFIMPETKGIPLEEIEQRLLTKRSRSSQPV
ncbi:MAG: sugar porter family MFS transporter [Thermogutta sp.]|nr:sugar porter family MFS transporter [Thermogutta sp.]HPU06744.1 sugar porter family MFS transporter [Thermogutta sp.]HQF14689.1 sugar porter family MFS transporter [Thermogutta sp.]